MTAQILYRSNELAANERIPIWQEVVWRNYVPLDIRLTRADSFTGFVSLGHLGSVRIVTSGSRPQRITRTPRLIRQDTNEYLMLGLQTRGRGVVMQGGREARLSVGDFVLWDTREPYDIVFPDDWEMAVYQFPRSAFRYDARTVGTITARSFSGCRGTSRAVSAFLSNLADEAQDGPLVGHDALLAAAVDMLTVCIDSSLQAGSIASSYDKVLARRIEDYVRANLGNPEFRSVDIAAAHGLSARQLHRVFLERGCTVGEFIRRLRMENIRADLLSRKARYQTIASIARKWGYMDTPHFNRAFKARYRITPTQWRAQQSGSVTSEAATPKRLRG